MKLLPAVLLGAAYFLVAGILGFIAAAVAAGWFGLSLFGVFLPPMTVSMVVVEELVRWAFALGFASIGLRTFVGAAAVAAVLGSLNHLYRVLGTELPALGAVAYGVSLSFTLAMAATCAVLAWTAARAPATAAPCLGLALAYHLTVAFLSEGVIEIGYVAYLAGCLATAVVFPLLAWRIRSLAREQPASLAA